MRTPQSELERRRLNERGRQILQRKAGAAVRPIREDGYVNLLNKYGTKQDNSEAYQFEREPMIPDMQLTSLYEGNGLFAKIIDLPAEEALKHGFDLNLKNDDIETFVEEALDDLDWEAKAATAIKWARLYGGSIIVMLIDDGRGLEEPVDWRHIRSIDELRVYERAIVQPDYTTLYMQDYGGKGPGNRVSKFGQPEFYYVSSIYGSFMVHESRCLVFRNGVLPEQSTNATYLFWGMPEYVRIRRALRETMTAHTDGVKLLERSVQAIYSMKNLAQLLATDDGENQVLKRLEVIDMARGLLNSIAIDSEGESYDFKTITMTGVKDIVDTTCNMLSAITSIPQTKLFGRSPAGMNATGEGDLENWYSYLEGLQKLMLKRNLRDLLDVVFRAGVASGEIVEEPKYKLSFNPLWSLSETEQAAVDQTKAQTAFAKAQATQVYVDMGALDPSEVRTALAADEEYNVEDVVSEEDDLLDALLGSEPDAMGEMEAAEKSAEQVKAPGGGEQSTGQTSAPATPSAPQTDADTPTGVGVLVLADGKVLCGTRVKEGTVGGPGGHIEPGETPEQAAVRETQEEFGITPKELMPITVLTGMPERYGVSQVYLCTEYDGRIACDGVEMSSPRFLTIAEARSKPDALFLPFSLSISALLDALFPDEKSDLTAADNRGRVKDREDFEESKHPRDENGQFTSGAGSSGGSSGESSGGSSSGSEEEKGEAEASSSTSGSFGGKTSAEFASALADAQAAFAKDNPEGAWRVTAHTQEELDADYPGAKMHVTEGGSTVAVTQDGDIISVCKKPGDTVSGKQLLQMAVENGGQKLDAFSGIYGFYTKCGFEPVSWCSFDEQFAPSGWTKGRDKPEPIVFYKYTGKPSSYGSFDDFKSSVAMSSDYDAAKDQRDNSL